MRDAPFELKVSEKTSLTANEGASYDYITADLRSDSSVLRNNIRANCLDQLPSHIGRGPLHTEPTPYAVFA